MDVCAQQRRGKNDKTLISTTMALAKTAELPFSHGCGPCGSKFEMSTVAWERSAVTRKCDKKVSYAVISCSDPFVSNPFCF